MGLSCWSTVFKCGLLYAAALVSLPVDPGDRQAAEVSQHARADAGVPHAERGCANETISLRNVGRETESFLWYINQRYHSLASYTLFTQAASMAPEVRRHAALPCPEVMRAIFAVTHHVRGQLAGVDCG